MVALIAGYACLLGGTIMVCRSVPTHAYDGRKDPKTGAYGCAASTVQRWIVAPVLAWAFLAPLWFSTVSAGQHDTVPFLSCTFAPVSLGAFAMLIAGYVIAAVTLGRQHWGAFGWNISVLDRRRGYQRFPAATRRHARPADACHDTRRASRAAVDYRRAGLHSTLYVGLRWTAAYAELDREWLAAAEMREVVPTLAWSVLAAITLILPGLVFDQWPTTYAAVVGFASGPVGAWLGRSAKSLGTNTSAATAAGAPWTGMVREAAITISTLLFAATLFGCSANSAPSSLCGSVHCSTVYPGWITPG